MFSLLTLQETHNIESFAKLADNVDVIPLSLNFEDIIRNNNNSILNQINQSRNFLKLGKDILSDEFPKEIIKPNRVFLDIYIFTETIFQSHKGLPIKKTSKKLLLRLLSHNAILTSNASDKAWVVDLKKW